MKRAKWIFLTAGIFGLILTIPLVFAEKVISVQEPEFYYGFVFLNICLQIIYVIISTSPIRYRPIMIPAFLAKATGSAALTLLYFIGRISFQWIIIGAVDGIFAVLFLIGYYSTPANYDKVNTDKS
ncbi:MAG: hypothetical protein JSV24_03670 [Bacteroidales bacterium]|nr:MAG: hypothetical protein JSV24_03670 [Bacteroidales bacterium]